MARAPMSRRARSSPGSARRTWLNEAYTACTTALSRPQRRTIRYLKYAEEFYQPDIMPLLEAPRKWKAFDEELFAAVLRY
eukprot:5431692-Pyramimonas_sp.AAC.1